MILPEKKQILDSDKFSSNPDIAFGKAGYNQAIDEITPKLQAAIDKACDVTPLLDNYFGQSVHSQQGIVRINSHLSKSISAHIRACFR